MVWPNSFPIHATSFLSTQNTGSYGWFVFFWLLFFCLLLSADRADIETTHGMHPRSCPQRTFPADKGLALWPNSFPIHATPFLSTQNTGSYGWFVFFWLLTVTDGMGAIRCDHSSRLLRLDNSLSVYITAAFRALASSSTVHHILLYGCQVPKWLSLIHI